MSTVLKLFTCFFLFVLSAASYHEQYRVPQTVTDKWESYIFNDREFLVQNLPVSWENAKIMCRGYHNGTLAVLDTRDKAEFLAEALSESQFVLTSVWVGARRDSAEDPAGYRWGQGLELRRTALDVIDSEKEGNLERHFPMWLNRTHVPVPDTGADCVALERVQHDSPVFLDLPCHLERPFACEREARDEVRVTEVRTVRCHSGLYHVFDGRMNWNQAAAYCVLRGMTLANIGSFKCLKKLGMTMLKNRPSIENAWIGAEGSLGKWTWLDTGLSVFQLPTYTDAQPGSWPPMRDRTAVKQSGCLQLDRHSAHPPVFLEARCERRMPFICYQGVPGFKSPIATPSDDTYYYVLVKQLLYWQHAYENCIKMNGTLASPDNNDILIQLLLAMGENKEQRYLVKKAFKEEICAKLKEGVIFLLVQYYHYDDENCHYAVEHIWISGRLNMSKDVITDAVTYAWYNPTTGKRIPDPKTASEANVPVYVPPWLDEEFSTDSSCLNLDRQDHLVGLVYGLPCDTPQYSVCVIEKTTKLVVAASSEGYVAQPSFSSQII